MTKKQKLSKAEINETIFKGIALVSGIFLLALTYNLLLYPNNLVVGGMSGIGIILEEVFGIKSTVFIYISTFVLLIISFIFLGKEMTSNTVIGSLLYPLFITFSSPIANYIHGIADINEYLVIISMAAIFYGVSNGIIYKLGYSTGGGDVIMQLLSKYLNIPSAVANFIYSFIIIFFTGIVFGISAFIYAIIILVVSNLIINKIIVGISNSKVFFICTKKCDELKKIIREEYGSGFTILDSKSPMHHAKGEVLMVVVPSRKYYPFRNRILELDEDAFFIINDCYEVNGGMRISTIPFIGM